MNLMVISLLFLRIAAPTTDTIRTPVVTLERTMLDPMLILMIRDTATSSPDISRVLGAAYGELFTFINKNSLKAGKVMAFYHSSQPPFIMDVAVEVDKLCNTTTGRVKINKVLRGDALVAHYKGPYDQIGMAYAVIAHWLQKQGKVAADAPFEVYLNDPVSVKDPFDLLTDVYQFIK